MKPVITFPETTPKGPSTNTRMPMLVGAIGIFVLCGLLGLWAATTVIGGAVIASGQLMVRGDAQLVQSLDGGLVADIYVENGDHVDAGELLMRLDPTLLRINLDIARGRLASALALQARLEAEQRDLVTPVYDYSDLPAAVSDLTLEMTQHEEGQTAIFTARADVLRGGRDQLAETLLQFENQIAGVQGQLTSIEDQIALVAEERASVQRLVDQGLARQSQLTDAQRAEADLRGQLSALNSDLARLTNAKRDSELDTLQRERAFKESVVTELRDVTAEIEELILEIVTRSAQLDRIDVRAPATGIIHEMQVTTVGGVVAPGATILEVIPQASGVEVEVRVDAASIDQVFPGQPAQVIMAAFDAQTTPQLQGHVTTISPTAIADPRTGQNFYRLNLEVPPEQMALLGDLRLVPGMPVEAFLETGDRSVLAYLVQPLSTHLRRAFRE